MRKHQEMNEWNEEERLNDQKLGEKKNEWMMNIMYEDDDNNNDQV